MRGSDHEQHPFQLFIESGGLRAVELTEEEAARAEADKFRRR
jgi:hypothetical protein